MLVTVTNISDELLILKAPFSMGDFTVSVWSRTALQPGESATADLDLLAPYDGGSFSFDHNLDPREFLISITFDASDLLRVKDATDTITIPNGDNTPSLADGTDFGDTNVNTTVSKTYIIENIGILPTAVSITVPSGYTLTSSPSGAILPGEQDSFTVRFDASASGDISGNISISTGSPNNYTFAITGHGNFYFEKVRSGLIQYLFLNELVGTVANDDSPENNDGAYSGVTLDAIDSPIPDDRAPSLGLVNLYSVALNSDFSGAAGSIVIWMKVSGAGIWTDATLRNVIRLLVDGSNFIDIARTATNNTLRYIYVAGGTTEIRDVTTSSTDWMQIALTWSKANERVRAYFNGVQQGADLTALGVWAGSLASANCVIGAINTAGTRPWSGYSSHYRLYNRELTADEIIELNTVP